VSWGRWKNVTSSGYIAINGSTIINTTSVAYRGFNLIELNISSCSSSKVRHFDTNANTTESDKMATYINSLPLYTVLVGVTADDAQKYFSYNAFLALYGIGVESYWFLYGSWYQSKLCFVRQIGYPSVGISEWAQSNANNLKITVNATGDVF
jgi:Interleukin-like EMT inducer